MSIRKTHIAAATAVAALVLTGCATVTTPTPGDPLESMNRTVFNFNDAVDRNVLKPVAKGYSWAIPQAVRDRVTSFFSNIGDTYTMANDLLQGKIADGTEDLMRVVMNTFFGIGGLFDFASQAGLPKHNQDFGLTLAHYGVPPGPYLVFPLFGPSTVRDSTDLAVTYFADPITYIKPNWASYSVFTVRLVNTRANLLGAGDLLNGAALDKYSFVRNAYLQQRQALSGGEAALPVYDDQAGASAAAPASAASAASASAVSAADVAAAASATSGVTAPVPLSGPNALSSTPASGSGAMNSSEVPPLWHYFPGLRVK